MNDAKSIADLILTLNPQVSVRARPRPTSLTREAGAVAVRNWVSDVATVVRATRAAGQQVRAVVIHQDADGPDPAGSVERNLADQFSLIAGRPVVPVQMIEAWWFLFPDAVESVRPRAWKNKLPRTHRDVERIVNPKQKLMRLTRRGRDPEYAEADSPAIAAAIRHSAPSQWGTSASFDRFAQMARQL